MVTMANVWTRVEAPPVVPHSFGLFSVAAPQSPADTDWQFGVQWQSVACESLATTVDACISGTTPPAKSYSIDCPNVSTVKPFTVYAGAKRSASSQDVARAQASAVLNAGEEFAVEQWLWGQLVAKASTVVTPGAWSTDPVLNAVANVEAGLGSAYHGTGVIHLNRGMAAALGSNLVRVGSHLETITGTPVVAGAGYGFGTVYGTGAVAIRRGTVEPLSAVDRAVNDAYELAERTYVAGWDCAALGVAITGG